MLFILIFTFFLETHSSDLRTSLCGRFIGKKTTKKQNKADYTMINTFLRIFSVFSDTGSSGFYFPAGFYFPCRHASECSTFSEAHWEDIPTQEVEENTSVLKMVCSFSEGRMVKNNTIVAVVIFLEGGV